MTRRTASAGVVSTPIFFAMVLIPACAGMWPPARNSGSSSSQEGVQVAVLQQQCSQTQSPDQPDNNPTEEIVQIQVHNAAASPLTIRRTEFHLVTPDGFALKTLTLGASDPLVLVAEGTRVFPLRFLTRGSVLCTRELQLDPGTGVVLGDKPVKLGPIHFMPSVAPESSPAVKAVVVRSCPRCDS